MVPRNDIDKSAMAQEDDQLGESHLEQTDTHLLDLVDLSVGILTLGWHYSMISQVNHRYQLFMIQQLSVKMSQHDY